MSFKQSEMDILCYWIVERDQIRVGKEAKFPKPWTEDSLFMSYRWCNVRRMDDRVSRWLLNNWYCLHGDGSTDLVAAVLARLVNWPDSLKIASVYERFGLWHLPKVRPRLLDYAARGNKVFTGAYVVPGVPGLTKVNSVCNLVEVAHAHSGEIVADTARGTWNNLVKLDGLGSFLAGQIVADMAHLVSGRNWPDRMNWAPLGPGSARGMNRLMGRDKKAAMCQSDFDELLLQLMDELYPRVQSVWNDRGLFAMDIQNCLCEFDKYRRLTLGEGTVRSRYDGAGVAQGSLL